MAAQTQTKKPKKTPVCVYWNADKLGYEIHMAEYIRGAGWVETTYLGFARDLRELHEIMKRFDYVHVCGISIDVDVSVDAAPRRHADCDAVSQLVGAC